MDTKMTFADLDQMVDYWATDLYENECRFHNQLQKINAIFWELEQKGIKLAMIEKRLAILNYIQMKMEMDVVNANFFAETMKQMIIKLEDRLIDSEGKDLLDTTRELYGLFEKTNINISYYKNEVDLIIRDINSIEQSNLKNPIESIAKIMTILLESLENIEMKMEQMKNRMHWIDNEIRNIICDIFHKK